MRTNIRLRYYGLVDSTLENLAKYWHGETERGFVFIPTKV